MEFELWSKIIKINLRYNFLPHLVTALIIVLLAPVVFETDSLDAKLSAQPLEMFLCLAGAILFTPIFLPEQDENIRDLIRSKPPWHWRQLSAASPSLCTPAKVQSAWNIFLVHLPPRSFWARWVFSERAYQEM